MGKLGEFELIRQLTTQRGYQRPEVTLGPGDDAAVVEEVDRCLLFTCDAQVEGTHFLSTWIDPFVLGQRIGAVNLSDIAAMGGRPLWALCSLLVSADGETAWYDKLYDGLYDELGRHHVQLIGGNIARIAQGCAVDLFLAGEAAKTQVLYRSGARPGDMLCVTETVGDSAAGLGVLQRDWATQSAWKSLVQKHLRPIPRVQVGQLLAQSGWVSACMDISDGLLQDVAHICTASRVNVVVWDSQLPISTMVREYCDTCGVDPVRLALTGGEDYELLFTVSPDKVCKLQQWVHSETGVRISAIGQVHPLTENRPLVRTETVQYCHEDEIGFDHLKTPVS